MFKILRLKLKNHPYLGDFEINFVDENKCNEEPFTTLILGTNGTGKSNILRAIVDILRTIKCKQDGEDKKIIQGSYEIEYKIENKNYKYESSPKKINLNTIKDIRLPEKIIASSVMLKDRFPMIENKKDEMYKYMGIRRTPSLAGTRTLDNRLILSLINLYERNNFKNLLKDVLEFLEFKNELNVIYYPRYRNDLFKGGVNKEKLDKFYFKLKKARWGLDYYNKIKDTVQLTKIIEFLNKYPEKEKKIGHRLYGLIYDVINSDILQEDYEIIKQLQLLNLTDYPRISVKKNLEFDISECSSGEYHFLISILEILTNIKQNSLILIDEPEISLHPNWQMKYINFLKRIFKDYKSCHFIIASHSHFLVSDLKNESSDIVSLKINDAQNISDKKNKDLISAELLKDNTYAWSAEDILYNVFHVKTVRNFSVEYDMRKLLSMISKNSSDFEEMARLLLNLKQLAIKPEDPLNIILNQAKEYLKEYVKTN